MKQLAWSGAVWAGTALLALGVVSARAEEAKGRSTASDSSRQGGSATGGGSTAPQDQPGAKSGTTPSTEGAKGSGMGGTSTGARPGEVSGARAGEASTTPSSKQQQLSGRVEKYDRESRTLSLANSKKKLKLSDDTEVTKDGQKVSPGQIMEGDEVRASYSGSGDTVEAKRLEVSSRAAPR